MNFDLTDEQRMLQAAARDFLAARLNSEKIRALAASDDAFSEDLWREMSELNWPGLMVSEASGGQELGMVELAVLMEQLGYALVPGPMFSNTLAGLALEQAGTDSQRDRYLSPLATGEKRGTLALWDAGAGWTPEDIRMQPERSNGGYTLNGEKVFVLDAATADFLIVGATGGLRLIVDRDADGRDGHASRHDRRDAQAVHGQARRRAGGRGRQLRRRGAARRRPRPRLHRAGRRVDGSGAARDGDGCRLRQGAKAVRPPDRRLPGGVASMRSDAAGDRGRSLARVLRGLGVRQRARETASLAASMAKAYASDAACRVTGSALQVHGGIGFTWEHDLHFWLKRARCAAVYLGDARWHRERVAQLAVDGELAAVAAEPLAAAAG